MTLKQVWVFILLVANGWLGTQNVDIREEIKSIDSLIEYHQNRLAEKRANELAVLIENNYSKKELVEERLKVRLLQGIIADNNFEHQKALGIFFEVLAEAEKHNLYKLLCLTNIKIALNQEKVYNYDISLQYLNAANELYKKHRFNDLYSSILIRYSLLHRLGASTKYSANTLQQERMKANGFVASKDSAVYYAEQSLNHALLNNNASDIYASYLTLGNLENDDRKKSNDYFFKAISCLKNSTSADDIAALYSNVSVNFLHEHDYQKALRYNDSAYSYYSRMPDYYKYIIPEKRAAIYDSLGMADSALFYTKIAFKDRVELLKKEEYSTAKRLEEQFQNDKKEAIIDSKNQQILYIILLLVVIAASTALVIRKNRKINVQNKIISKQVEELVKTLEQKQVLLSELQHRVKNNLQHVISILEIQKESVDFNNIDELIRGNQNRIHSMALLHNKLNASESVQEVDLKKYVSELAELVKGSYQANAQKIILNLKCDIEIMSLEKALPIGLIIVELVSNSMKHAFKNRTIGMISISITQDAATQKKHLHYVDNGHGFDFNTTKSKGLGLEIIKGFADQLNGSLTTNGTNGFELNICF